MTIHYDICFFFLFFVNFLLFWCEAKPDIEISIMNIKLY